MEKVYLVIDEWVLGGDEAYDQYIKAFSTREKAEKFFNERVDLAKVDANEWSLDKIDEYGDVCEAYRDGYYDNYHIRIEIKEKEVE